MSTQIIEAQAGNITQEMSFIAQKEEVSEEFVREKVAQGRIVILKNNQRQNSIPVAVGEGMSIKINANIGTSNERSTLEQELDKVRVIEQTGADVLMEILMK